MENIAQITDKEDRTITIYLDDLDVLAKHNGVEVGRLTFDEVDHGYQNHIKLLYMCVEEKYRRSGIALQMLRCAVDLHGRNFEKPSLNSVGGRNVSSSEYYTQEGQALISYCINQNILDDNDREHVETEDDYV